MRLILTFICSLLTLYPLARAHNVNKIYGVNLGSWLVLEPWMLPEEWLAMGGENCADCSTCIRSEFALAQAYPDTVDERFRAHWESWFNEGDVVRLQQLGINTVRIPLGYWIIEMLVNRATEFYPRGGIKQLRRGLTQLKSAGIAALLDHHALPGVASPMQMFAGRCTNDVQFYTSHNYARALTWTAVMTAFSHLDSSFSNVFGIEAVNEPIMDANQTPGYGKFQHDFVLTVRAVELILGVGPGERPPYSKATNSVAQVFTSAGTSNDFNPDVRAALQQAAPILTALSAELQEPSLSTFDAASISHQSPLLTTFMDVNWQFNNPANPADAAMGPQLYDNHLYFAFGGVAAPNEDSYMRTICNINRIADDAARGNSPLVFGEWSLAADFPVTNQFLSKFADTQKLVYSKSRGWIYWNFKAEKSALAGNLIKQWSYFDAVELGFMTTDPAQLNDPNVCAPYTGNSRRSTSDSEQYSTSKIYGNSTVLASSEIATDTGAGVHGRRRRHHHSGLVSS